MNAVQQIMSSLNAVFAPLDAEVVANSKEWAQRRVSALQQYKASSEYAEISKKGAWGGMYDKLFDIAGGKTWYQVFSENNKAGIDKFVEKNCAATAEARNAKITAKLVKLGVTEVESSSYVYSKDGFDGVFFVQTNAGKKHIKIETIRAGGYNIQRLHLRVLVHVS